MFTFICLFSLCLVLKQLLIYLCCIFRFALIIEKHFELLLVGNVHCRLKYPLRWQHTCSGLLTCIKEGPTCRGNLCGPCPAHCQCLQWCNQSHTGTPSCAEQQAWAPGPDEQKVSWSCRSHLRSCWSKRWPCCSGTEAQHPDDCRCQLRDCGNWRHGY